MDWYEQWFNEHYLELYPHRSRSEAKQQVDFLLDGPLKKVGNQKAIRLLDIACGNGRHLVEFRKHGIDAAGIDLSTTLLDRARSLLTEELDTSNLDTILQQADMRKLPFADKTFDVLTNFFTSFGYFNDEADQIKALVEWQRVCKRNGLLLIDYLNRDFVLSTLAKDDEWENDRFIFRQQRSISDDSLRVEKEIQVIEKDSGSTNDYLESVRMFSKSELEALLKQAGFVPVQAYSGFSDTPFDSSSPRLLIVSKNISIQGS